MFECIEKYGRLGLKRNACLLLLALATLFSVPVRAQEAGGDNVLSGMSGMTGMSLGGGPAMGIVSGEYRYSETIVTGANSAQNSGHFGATDMVYGAYVNGTLLYHVQDAGRNADIYIGIQYMPLGKAGFSGPGRTGQLNLDGQIYLSAGISWPF